jgi:hypothetical protein
MIVIRLLYESLSGRDGGSCYPSYSNINVFTLLLLERKVRIEVLNGAEILITILINIHIIVIIPLSSSSLRRHQMLTKVILTSSSIAITDIGMPRC